MVIVGFIDSHCLLLLMSSPCCMERLCRKRFWREKKSKEAAEQETCKGRARPGLEVGSPAPVVCSLLGNERIAHPTHFQIPGPRIHEENKMFVLRH